MLDERVELSLARMDDDHRIGPVHISVYIAIARRVGSVGFVLFYSHELMRLAKIAGRATYFQTIHDLHLLKYISYEPSYCKNERSRFYLL